MCIKVYIDLNEVLKHDAIYSIKTKTFRYTDEHFLCYVLDLPEYEYEVCTGDEREEYKTEQRILRYIHDELEKIEKTRVYLLDENSKTVVKTW